MLKIRAFNDFWLDCYTTMLYSILLSGKAVDKAYIYNNNYCYCIKEQVLPITGRRVDSLCSINNNSVIEDRMLINGQRIRISLFKKPMAVIKELIDKQKIVMLKVDLYYWIKENIHYLRNHIQHYSLVREYDEIKEELVVFETGLDGYKEFRISAEQAIKAIRHFDGESLVYDINYDVGNIMYTKENVLLNANNIVLSIDSILEHEKDILCFDGLSERELTYVSDILQTHIFNLQNREKVNRHLFMIGFKSPIVKGTDFCSEFEMLEKQFEVLKNVIMRNNMRKEYNHDSIEIKSHILSLLNEEKKIWNIFANNYGELEFQY